MPILAISNREQIGYSAETTWGTTVAANPIKLVRFVSGSFKNDTSSTQSAEIQNNREIADIIRTGIRGSGSFNVEWSYGMLDDLLQYILGGTWTANVLKVGTTRQSVTIERQFLDVTRFHAYKGGLLTGITLNCATGKVIDGAVTFKSMAFADASATAGTGTTAAPTNAIMNPVDSVQLVQVGGVTMTGVSDFSISFSQADIDFAQVGSINPADIKQGAFIATGTFSVFYDDTINQAILASANNWTSTPIQFTVGGVSNQKYNFLFNKTRIAAAEVANGGMNQPYMAKYSFSAYVDATNTTCQITRTP